MHLLARRLPAALGIALVAWCAPRSVAAEQVTSGETGAGGARWQQGVVELFVDASVSLVHGRPLEAAVGAVSAWQDASPFLPTLVVRRAASLPMGYEPKGENVNVVRFAEEGEPMARGALAITIVTYDERKKRILDADIVLNGVHPFGRVGRGPKNEAYDVENVLTHELGHFLGLGEDFDNADATMFAYSAPGETDKRDLSSVDIAAISSLYDSEPTNPPGGCSGASMSGVRGASNGGWPWFAGLLAGLIILGRRHRALAALMIAAALVPPANVAQASSPERSLLYARGTVLKAESYFDGGLIVTELALGELECDGRAPNCSRTRRVSVYGGRVGDLVQVVGRALPPPIGAPIELFYEPRALRSGPVRLLMTDRAIGAEPVASEQRAGDAASTGKE